MGSVTQSIIPSPSSARQLLSWIWKDRVKELDYKSLQEFQEQNSQVSLFVEE